MFKARITKPAVSDVFLRVEKYSDTEFYNLETAVNKEKSTMDEFGKSPLWSRLQPFFDKTSGLKKLLYQYNAQNVSNAWLKYWELYYTFVDRNPHETSVFFNAELPGASLSAWNHFAHNFDIKYQWKASSLYPNKSSDNKNISEALGDIYKLYEYNNNNWIMDELHTGNVTIKEDIEWIEKNATCDLYSHDAGIGVDTDPSGKLIYNSQELLNQAIHLGCAICGFITLNNGGTFIAKQYTFFDTLTWQLIIYYASLFEEFYIVKPETSRPYNSEIYLVGRGFLGITADQRKFLFDLHARVVAGDNSPIFNDQQIKQLYQLQYIEILNAGRAVYTNQIMHIRENVKVYKQLSRETTAWLRSGKSDTIPLNHYKTRAYESNRAIVNEWIRKYPVKSISDEDKLKSIANTRPSHNM